MKEGRKVFIRLDILRILSCILVLLYHLNIIQGGYLAVCTFFVLSGYLNCLSALKAKEFRIKEYYKKRFQKVYLPLIIVVCLTVLFSKVFAINWLNLKQESISALLGYNNFWQLKTNLDYFTKSINSPLIHLWYISILIQLDILFPLCFIGMKKLEEKLEHNSSIFIVGFLTFVTTILIYCFSISEPIMNVYYNTFLRSFSFLWGILLALFHQKEKYAFNYHFKKFSLEIYLLYLVAFTALCIFISDEDPLYALFMIIVSMITCRLIEYSVIEKKKTNKVLETISKSTYEIYLVQYPVLFFMQSVRIEPNIKLLLIILITLVISFILHFIINQKTENLLLKNIRYLLLGTIILLGIYTISIEKDHTKEMKTLENKLNENLILMREKNKEYHNTAINEEKQWNELLEKMDSEEETVISEQLKKLPVVGIGDSVFLNAVPQLYDRFPNGYFDGEVSRSVYGGVKVINELAATGRLSNNVVLALATNTVYSDAKVDMVIHPLGDRNIYWINSVGGDDIYFNSQFEEYAKSHPNIHIIDWEGATKTHPEFFYSDGIHPRREGIDKYADLIYEAIYNVYLEEYREKKQELLKQKEEEYKKKITFYGNDALINSYAELQKKYENASFNAKEYDYSTLYNEIKEKVENNILEYKVIFVFDKNFIITEEEQKNLINLCKDHMIYIVNLTGNNIDSEKDVIVINAYKDLKKEEDTYMADGIHLTEKGNDLLVNKIKETIKISN